MPRLRLSTAYTTTAKIYIIVFYCLFQANISEFNMCFSIRYLGFYHCLCISYAPFCVMIFLRIAPHPFVFTHIIWDLLGWISGSNTSALRFLTLFLEFLRGGRGPEKRGHPALFLAPPYSTAWGGVSFSAFPVRVPAQAPDSPLPLPGPH